LDQIEGLILKQTDFKESSKILHVYTETGLKSVLTHGAKQLKSPFLRLAGTLNLIRYYSTGKGLAIMTDGELIDDFRVLKADLDKGTYATHLIELVYFFAEGDLDHQKLYPFLIRILSKISESIDYIPYAYMFELKLLHLLGVSPQFDGCIVCQSKEAREFSVEDGGMVCLEHSAGKHPFSSETTYFAAKLYFQDLKNPFDFSMTDVDLRALRILIDEYYRYHLNFQSKTRQLLAGLLGY
jgi:DNA repair protein RecO (recombination protein O)